MQPTTVNREEFLQRLEAVQPGIAPREFIEQTTCFIFDKGMIVTFNDEVSCRIISGLHKDFQGAVQAQPLLETLRKLTETEIEISTKEEEKEANIVIRGKSRKAGIRLHTTILMPL